MADVFKLPGSSYDELQKIIRAYANGKPEKAQTLHEVSQNSGIAPTVISSNNGFLVDVDLLAKGKAKTSTETCRKLGTAYEVRLNDEIKKIWGEIIDGNEFLGRMVSALRIRNGMDRVNFISHIIYSSGQKASKASKTGAGTIIEILKVAEYAIEENGKITAQQEAENRILQVVDFQPKGKKADQSDPEIVQNKNASSSKCYQIVFNINITIGIDEMDQVLEKIKKIQEEINL